MKRVSKMIRFSVWIASTLICAAGCSSVDLQVQESLKYAETGEPLKLAVLPFHIKGADWGDEFAQSVGLHLARTGNFVQVERAALKNILREQEFGESGLVDPRTRSEIGRLTGADLILTGTGQMLNYRDAEGRGHSKLIDTCTITAVDVGSGEHLITVRKSPGRAWDWRYRTKYAASMTLIWDSEDVLVDSSNYDDFAYQIAQRIDSELGHRQAREQRMGENGGAKNEEK